MIVKDVTALVTFDDGVEFKVERKGYRQPWFYDDGKKGEMRSSPRHGWDLLLAEINDKKLIEFDFEARRTKDIRQIVKLEEREREIIEIPATT